MKLANISVDYINHCGDDLSVVNAARVSFDKESFDLNVQDEKLIKYLAKHKHFSPFNHSFITMRIKAPIFVARQLVKHKFLPWNEVSRRYVEEEPEFYLPEHWRKKAENVKQGSGDKYNDVIWTCSAFGSVGSTVRSETNELCERALGVYQDMLQRGVAPEQARMILPQNMMTTWIWSGTLGAFCDMLRLRLDSHTQYETRIVAEKVKEIVQQLFPISTEELLNA